MVVKRSHRGGSAATSGRRVEGLDEQTASLTEPPPQDRQQSVPKKGKQKNAKWPCGRCEAEVGGNSVSCAACDRWFHKRCTDLEKLPTGPHRWRCDRCLGPEANSGQRVDQHRLSPGAGSSGGAPSQSEEARYPTTTLPTSGQRGGAARDSEVERSPQPRREKMRVVRRSKHTNIVTLNCQSLNNAARKNQLSKTLNDLNAHLACLQETRMTDADNKQFIFSVPPPNATSNQQPAGYTIYAGSADNGYAGCAVAVRNDISPLVDEWASPSSRIAYVHFKNVKTPTWVISAYAPTRDASDAVKDEFYAALKSVLDTIPRKHLVILGMDANAQFGADENSPSLGRWYLPSEETNENGERVLQMAEEYDMCLANTVLRTKRHQRVTWSSGAKLAAETKDRRRTGRLISQLDYVLVPTRWAKTIEKAASVRRSDFPSDHRPVTVRMKLRYVAPKKDRQKRYDVQRLVVDDHTMEEYQKDVLNRLIPPRRHRADVHVTAADFTRAITEARDAHVPELKAEKQRPLVSAAAERLVSKMAEARRQNDVQQAERARNALRRQLKRDKEELWQRRVEAIEDAWRCNNSKKVYTLLRRYSGRLKAASDTLEVDGRCVAGERCLGAWESHFSNLLNRPPPTGEPLRPEMSLDYGIEDGPPTAAEVARAIGQMKNGKAAGEDGVQPELLKALPPLAVTTLAAVYKSIWDTEAIPDAWRTAVVIPLHKKGTTTNPANYRGISLLDVQYKLMERIIVNRMLAVRDQRTREEQAGFRPGRSTVDQILVLRRVLEQHHRFRRPIAVAFLDFACAFDSPDRQRIYELLRRDGVPEKLVSIIREMNSESTAVVRTRSGCSKPFPVATGVRQGSVMAPMLFNYAIDAIMREAIEEFQGGVQLLPSEKVLTDLDYADDIALLSTSSEELQRLIDKVSHLAERMGLRLKPAKCELLSTLPEGEEPLKVYGEEIKRVPSFCYLGSIITADGSVKKDVSQRIRKARAAFATLQRCLWSTNVSRKMKLRVYTTAIRPILLYASETWPLTQSEEERLSRAERNFLRRALGIRQMDMVSNQELWKRVSRELAPKRLTDLATTIRKNRLKLLGHHLRRDPQRLTRIAIEYAGEAVWRRPPGGTRTTWLETTKRDLDRLRIRELPQFRGTEAVTYWNRGEWLRVITMLAEDREAWQQTIEKLCGREANTIGSRSTDPS